MPCGSVGHTPLEEIRCLLSQQHRQSAGVGAGQGAGLSITSSNALRSGKLGCFLHNLRAQGTSVQFVKSPDWLPVTHPSLQLPHACRT
eukprot:1136680-Pelagomonas_calceolata.AAC.1